MYHHVFVAGTFDGLHHGHNAVLSRAFAEGEHVAVGVTTDRFVKDVKKLEAGSFRGEAERKKTVTEWIKQRGWLDRAVLVDVDDPYEPAASGDYDAIVVTSQNEHTAKKINEIRHERSLAALTLLAVAIVPSEDGAPISSTRIRSHEIDAWGTLLLPDSMRPELREPMGDIVRITDLLAELKGRKAPLVTVGDVTTDRMLFNGIVPDLAIIDLHVHRQPYKLYHDYNFPHDMIPVHMRSGPGNISRDALRFISQWGKTLRKFVLVVHGEDDLLVLPVIYYAPIGTIVLYGQPGVGIVRLLVTPELQEKALQYLEKFRRE
jgi:cytidyltransferase-like protein